MPLTSIENLHISNKENIRHVINVKGQLKKAKSEEKEIHQEAVEPLLMDNPRYNLYLIKTRDLFHNDQQEVRDPPYPVLGHLADVQKSCGQLLDGGGSGSLKGEGTTMIYSLSPPSYCSYFHIQLC